jgi:hypothetical protein
MRIEYTMANTFSLSARLFTIRTQTPNLVIFFFSSPLWTT